MEGKVIWITGLAGSGKTTLAKNLCDNLKKKYKHVIHLDGDTLREILGNVHGYTIKDRIMTAKIYSRLAKNLSEQGSIVVISTISLFHEIHEYNRKNIKNYFEVFLDVSKEILERRNQKKLYTEEKQNVMGIHQIPEFPKNPHIIIINHEEKDINENIKIILKKLNLN